MEAKAPTLYPSCLDQEYLHAFEDIQVTPVLEAAMYAPVIAKFLWKALPLTGQSAAD